MVPTQVLEIVSNHRIAPTRSRFPPPASQKGDLTADIVNDAGVLQAADGLDDAHAACTEQSAGLLLRDGGLVDRKPVDGALSSFGI